MERVFLQGDKRAIILCHAYTGTPADVRILGTALNQKGYTVLMPLLAGHGSEDMRHILEKSPQEWLNQIQEAVEELLDLGCLQVAVFGLSMGGMLSIAYLTKKHPQVIGGGSFNSPIPLGDYKAIHEQFMAYARARYQTDFGEQETYLQSLKQASLKQLESLEIFTENIVENLSAIETPVYIAQSGQDELIDPSTGENLVKLLPFAQVDYHYFEEAKHVITVGAQRRIFNETVLNFVESLEWS